MSPFFLGLTVGAAIGIFAATYALSPSFRGRLNSSIGGALGGVISGKKSRKKNNNNTVITRTSRRKLHQCPVCQQEGDETNMQEVGLEGSRAKLWIHDECLPEEK